MNYTIRTAELNGDGADDLFVWFTDSKEYRLICSERTASGVNPLGHTETFYSQEKWDRVEFGDFNGDGLMDVINLDGNGCTIMHSDGNGAMAKNAKMSWPNKNHYIEMGDFNGDGKTDMLLTGWSKDTNKSGWSEWCVNYSKGNGTFVKHYCGRPFDTCFKQLYVADFDGDGFDDIQAIDKTSPNGDMTQPQVWLSDGKGEFYQQIKGGYVYAVDKWRFYAGDFNGDGRTDLVCTSDWNRSDWDGCQLYLMPSDMHSLLTEIKDGLGNVTKIGYKYLTDKSVFTRGCISLYPLVSVSSTWPVVSSVSTPDGIGGTNIISYRYEDALFHKAGRGLLGFSACITKDETNNTLTVTEYSVNTAKYVIAPIHSRTTIDGKLIEENYTTYALRSDYAQYSGCNDIYTYMPVTTHQASYEFNTGTATSAVETSYEYDAYGNVTKTKVKDGNIEITSSNTYRNDIDTWILGRLTECVVSKTNENGTITRESTFEYEKSTGLLSVENFAPSHNDLGYRKTYAHDAFGNITQSTISSFDGSPKRVSQTSYDAKGRFVVSSTNSLGFTKTQANDNALGLVMSSTDANGIVTNYCYDKFGNVISESTPITQHLTTTGWSAGMADAPKGALYFTWSKMTGEPETIEFFDCLGHLLRKVTESVNGRKVFVDQVYNGKGQIQMTSEPYYVGGKIYWSLSKYDAVGRTILQTAPDGSCYEYQYSGLKTVTVDPLGHTYTKINDLNGLLVASVDNAGTTVTYKYNADGKCIETSGPRTTINCSYDIAGNRTELDDSDIGISRDTYNAFGELVYHADGSGYTLYKYDAGGRIVLEHMPDMTISTTYDKGWKGAVAERQCVGKTMSIYVYIYDNYGRLTGKQTFIDNKKYNISYTYNSINRVETIRYPNGLEVRNEYDACGIQTSVSDAASRNMYWKLLDINARGQVEAEGYGNGLVTTTEHDPVKGTVSSILTPGIQNWFYGFDVVGNLVTRRDMYRNLTEEFLYDRMYRLTGVCKNRRLAQQVNYDEVGNIIYKSDVGVYSYVEGTNRLSAISECKRNLVSWEDIEYNSFGKISLVVSDGKAMSIVYGPDKKKVLVEIQGVKRYYVDNLFEQRIDANGISTTSYIFASGKAVAIVSQAADGGNIVFVHHDHLGSIQAFSNGAGKLYQELSYDAWGLRRNPDTWATYAVLPPDYAINEHGFGGHEHIDIFELIDMGGRMYDPVVGRFLSADPFVQSPDFTQSLNRYAYCINNPLSLIDPSGYSWFSRNWKSLFASVVGIAVSVATLGSGASLGAVVIAGAAGGAASALTGALLNGANICQIAKSTFTGGFLGSVNSFLNFASGGGSILEQLFKHTLSQGWLEGLQGGNMFHGFMMGAVSAGGGLFTNNVPILGKSGKIVLNASLAGAIDEIGGGKFANGAITGAFSIMFNDFLHKKHIWDRNLKSIFKRYQTLAKNFENDSSGFYEFLGGPLGKWASDSPELFGNTCAAKLSYALNYSGYAIKPHTPNAYLAGDGKWYFINAKAMSNYLENLLAELI